MLQTRVIPVLLLKNKGLVKTIKFKEPKYIGDPLNAVKIFNEKEVDELVFLDITASKENRPPHFDLIADIATECFMPFGYGGGIRSIEDIKKLFEIGVEKVILNSILFEKPELISEASNIFGSQSIIISIDVKKNFWGKYEIYSHSGTRLQKRDLLAFLNEMVEKGAGEILINSIDKDGTMKGYDLELIKTIVDHLSIPVVACGGAGSLEDLKIAKDKTRCTAFAAGSLFVYHGKHKAVLINYPKMEGLSKYL